MTARYQIHAHIAVITIDNPPINSMGLATRQGLDTSLKRAIADSDVQGIIITGAGDVFSGGADIREFGKAVAMQSPTLHDLIRACEASPKPVVAAINGVCMGGGTEISLGCHFRVAAPAAMIGLPEVKIGILPGAGGTQRLPRLAGVELALDMIVSGDAVKSELLARTRALDKLIEGDFLMGALAFTTSVIAFGAKLPRVRDMTIDMPYAAAFFAEARAKVSAASKHFPAPLKCVDAVEAAVLRDIDDGLEYEFQLFSELVATAESAALRHAFFAERAASKIVDVPANTPTRPINCVAVIGAGTMGGGISMNFLNAGIAVTMLETSQVALDRGVATIRQNYANSVKRGRLSVEKSHQRMALLTASLDYDDIKNADLVIEAVFEDIGVKKQVFNRLDAAIKSGAILASNTSTLDLNRIANFTQRPQDVVGLHFFSPANVMKLLEVVRGAATSKEVLATVMQLAKKIKKTAVVSGVCDGFIGNRMIEQYSRQAMFMLDEGASVAQIDHAIETFGFAMGPFRMGDLAGNDIGWHIRQRRYIERPDLTYSKIGDRVCELGRFGQKSGAGWYDYQPGDRSAYPSAAVATLLEECRLTSGIEPRQIGDEEICQRLLYALVNEGAHILDEGIAQRASDIDVVYLAGYGFPLWRGGPMHYAESVGLANVVASMKSFANNAHADPAFWKPASLLAACAKSGNGFDTR